MEWGRSSKELGVPNGTSVVEGEAENGRDPKGICHWLAESVDMMVWNKSSESGQIRSKSKSRDCDCPADGGGIGGVEREVVVE